MRLLLTIILLSSLGLSQSQNPVIVSSAAPDPSAGFAYSQGIAGNVVPIYWLDTSNDLVKKCTANPCVWVSIPRVSTVFGRTGSVDAQTGDYSWTQIGSKPSTFTPTSHGNESHSSTFITGLDWNSVTGKPSTFTPASHGNEAHSSTFITGLDWNSVTGKPSSFPPAAHDASLVTSGVFVMGRLATGTPNGSKFIRDDGVLAVPASGSDPWSYVSISGSNFTTSSATAVDITGLAFTPAANQKYEFAGQIMVRTATATVNPRVGLAWSTGLTDGVASIDASQTATTQLNTRGNIAAALLTAVGGLPNTTQSWPVEFSGVVIAGASPTGTVRVQLASETAGTVVTAIVGSFLRYRTF